MTSPAVLPVEVKERPPSFRLEEITDDEPRIEYPQGESAQVFEFRTALSSEALRRVRLTSPPKLLNRARLRLGELRRIIGGGYQDEDEVQSPLSEFAIQTALDVTRQLESKPPQFNVAFSPMPDGGVRLQVVGVERTVSVVVTPDGRELLGQYASSTSYDREELNGAAAAGEVCRNVCPMTEEARPDQKTAKSCSRTRRSYISGRCGLYWSTDTTFPLRHSFSAEGRRDVEWRAGFKAIRKRSL